MRAGKRWGVSFYHVQVEAGPLGTGVVLRASRTGMEAMAVILYFSVILNLLKNNG